MNPYTPPNQMWEFNGTIEQPLKADSVLRLSYVYDHSTNLDQPYSINNAMSDYVYQIKTGTTAPQGTYSNVSKNPYDNHTYSNISQVSPTGWGNYNAFTANYQRLYKKGYSYSVVICH